MTDVEALIELIAAMGIMTLGIGVAIGLKFGLRGFKGLLRMILAIALMLLMTMVLVEYLC